ncbi:SAVED domain-containing protein [Runella limosa]|uniref:SAVED domain-containing protein n=1 Tax=Runella limosa TaxID=370978 RepID=UPI00040E245B|nr:SAVED domain-containing protein [Runella limosa]
MGRNVIARQDGDDYQAKFFWLKASYLNQSHTQVKKVAWELDSNFGFDDVVVYYEPAIKDLSSGTSIDEEYFQVKFHVDHDRGFTWEAFMEPDFIGAKQESLLQRLYKIYLKDPIKFANCRYYIINTWGVDHSNDFKNLLSNNGGIRPLVLFSGGDRSKFGKIRKAWKEHLNIQDDDELKDVLASLRIKHSFDDEQRLRENLNTNLLLAGLKPIPADQLSGKYGDLIQKLHKTGRNIFTKDEILEICRQEELLAEVQEARQEDAFVIGVRSFQKGAETLELEVHTIACFLHCFSGRFLLEEYAEMEYIKLELERIAQEAISSKKRIFVHLDTHLSIALLLGYHMDSKYGGLDITVVQKTFSGKLQWRAEAEKIREYQEPLWIVEEQAFSNEVSDIALTISATHDIRTQVNAYLQEMLPNVSRSIDFTISPKPGSVSIKDANHIMAAIGELIGTVRSRRYELAAKGQLHLFIAAPNALAFYLGQRIKPLGKVTLYEFDLENERKGGYHPIITIP